MRRTVEETPNALFDEVASELVGTERNERTAGREADRGGHYTRRLVTGVGEAELSVPKLRGATFRTAVIERYRRRETSVEVPIVEMCLAGVFTRRIEDVSELLWGAPVSSGTVSNLNERPFVSIEEVAGELESMRLGAAARTVRDGFAETLAYTEFPPERWRRIRTNKGAERLNREIRRRTRVVGTFPDGSSALMLVTARLKHIAEREWGRRGYLGMSKPKGMDELKEQAEG